MYSIYFDKHLKAFSIPVATRSKARVCGRPVAEIAGSNSSGAWKFVPCECCVLTGRGPFVGLITRPEECY